jgi:N-hydroxyarylamine O-acetyltransferase
VDVGFGNGFLEPLPLEEGARSRGFLRYRLDKLDAEWWRYRQFHGGPSFDFTLEPYRLADFADGCHTLQTSPESGFVKSTVCHRFFEDAVVTLRGAILRRVDAEGTREEMLTTPEGYAQVLQEGFGLALEPGDLAALWPEVWAQHLAWRAAQPERGGVPDARSAEPHAAPNAEAGKRRR